ncbi:MAG TPA: Uma2 family endonuclease [Abditibacteriaceae bacterium]
MSTITSKKPIARRLSAPKNPPRESLITVEQWAALGEVKPPYELINGILVRKMVTTNEHDWTARRIARFCDEWADESNWRFFSQGAGTRLDLFNGFVPDVMGFPPSVQLSAASTYNPPPFIAFEVLSPATAKADRGDKKRAYENAGVQFYVIVDLKKRTLEIYRLQNGKYGKPEILKDDALWQPEEMPGFKLAVQRLWF